MSKSRSTHISQLSARALIFGLMIIFSFAPVVLAKETPAKKAKTTQPTFKELKPQIEKGYKELQALYKKKSHDAFSKKVESLKAKLSQPSVPPAYRKSMLRKILELGDQMNAEYANVQAARERKQDAALYQLLAQDAEKKGAVQYSDDPAEDKQLNNFKKQHDQQDQRIREQILKKQPAYRQDHDGLEDAIVDRKVVIVRQREFLMTEFEKGAEAQYQTGVRLYNQKEYSRSEASFLGLEKMVPNYKETRDYLKKLKKLAKESPKKAAPKVVKTKKSVTQDAPPKVEKLPPPPEEKRDNTVDAALNQFQSDYAGEKREQ